MAKMGKYLYCFINEKEKLNFGISEIGGLNAPVYNIVNSEISAVVSDAPLIEYDPTRKNILSHQKVINRLMEKYPVIPVSFATVAGTKSEVENLISRYYDEFAKVLAYLKNKVELGLRVTWNREYFNGDIEDDDITALKNKIAGRPESEVFKNKIQLGQMVEKAVLSKREEYIDKIYNPLSEIAVESNLSEKLPVKTVFNAYFLVEKEREKDFDSMVEVMTEDYKGRLDFIYTGPWPPYNFVDIKISLH